MIEIQPAIALLLVEALAVLMLVQIVSIALAWRRRRRESRAVSALVASVADDASPRGERNSTAIGAALGASGEALETHAKAVESATKSVLKGIVVGWSRRDATSIEALPATLEALNAKWRELLAAAGSASPPTATVDDAVTQAHESAVASLTAEKKAVEDELAITRETMTRMLNEYAAMYQRGGKAGDTPGRNLLSDDDEPDAASAANGKESAAAPTPKAPAVASSAVKPTSQATPAVKDDDSGDDRGDVTEDDLDALFDAQPDGDRATPVEPPDPMLAELDLEVEDPFDGLEDDEPATAETGTEEQQAAKAAAAT